MEGWRVQGPSVVRRPVVVHPSSRCRAPEWPSRSCLKIVSPTVCSILLVVLVHWIPSLFSRSCPPRFQHPGRPAGWTLLGSSQNAIFKSHRFVVQNGPKMVPWCHLLAFRTGSPQDPPKILFWRPTGSSSKMTRKCFPGITFWPSVWGPPGSSQNLVLEAHRFVVQNGPKMLPWYHFLAFRVGPPRILPK